MKETSFLISVIKVHNVVLQHPPALVLSRDIDAQHIRHTRTRSHAHASTNIRTEDINTSNQVAQNTHPYKKRNIAGVSRHTSTLI
jgi:hypothetical protein